MRRSKPQAEAQVERGSGASRARSGRRSRAMAPRLGFHVILVEDVPGQDFF